MTLRSSFRYPSLCIYKMPSLSLISTLVVLKIEELLYFRWFCLFFTTQMDLLSSLGSLVSETVFSCCLCYTLCDFYQSQTLLPPWRNSPAAALCCSWLESVNLSQGSQSSLCLVLLKFSWNVISSHICQGELCFVSGAEDTAISLFSSEKAFQSGEHSAGRLLSGLVFFRLE